MLVSRDLRQLIQTGARRGAATHCPGRGHAHVAPGRHREGAAGLDQHRGSPGDEQRLTRRRAAQAQGPVGPETLNGRCAVRVVPRRPCRTSAGPPSRPGTAGFPAETPYGRMRRRAVPCTLAATRVGLGTACHEPGADPACANPTTHPRTAPVRDPPPGDDGMIPPTFEYPRCVRSPTRSGCSATSARTPSCSPAGTACCR